MMLEKFKGEIQQELLSIMDFWTNNSIDSVSGGFIGQMDNDGNINTEAKKGSVLNARILYAFSSIYAFTKREVHLLNAHRAFEAITIFFWDNINGGVYWSIDKNGEKVDGRKQIYALSFAMYGLTAYYKITKNIDAKNKAIELFEIIEKYGFDTNNGGYFEAFSETWEALEDVRLSKKDRNDPKTMNTHLHIIEAYSSLYEIWQSENLKSKIIGLLDVFDNQIIDSKTQHLGLFFDNEWNKKSESYSYGHDIEASWLLYKSAEIINETSIINAWKLKALGIADAALEGMNEDGSLNHEFDPVSNELDSHREWWVSAEAMVGYFNTYQLSSKAEYLQYVFSFWEFTKKYIIDKNNGEWFWGINSDYSTMEEDKIGFWKCPYHNTRACIELLNRIENLD